MPLFVIRNDITKMQVDAIVNAANTGLRAGGGVCGAIFNAAGADRLQEACDELAPIKTGDAVITKGYSLPAKYVIHAAGPVYRDGTHGEEELLRSCYVKSLDLAKKHGCESIAFPLISSGIYGYPKDEALVVATDAIAGWLMKNDMDVSLVVFDKAAFSLSHELLGAVKVFIDENYVDEQNIIYSHKRPPERDGSVTFEALGSVRPELSVDANHAPKRDKADRAPKRADFLSVAESPMPGYGLKGATADMLGKLDEPFSNTLLRLIDAKGKTDTQIYKRANLDRKLFSKIRTGKGYMPSKKTVVALAVALELTLPETRNFLERAGFALSHSLLFDVIVEYFISRKKYDIFEINNILFEYDQQLLGG